MDTGMVCPLAVREHCLARFRTRVRWIESGQMRIVDETGHRLAEQLFLGNPSSRCVASLQLFTKPSGAVTSTESLKLLSTVFR